jgi:hypothetical protein
MERSAGAGREGDVAVNEIVDDNQKVVLRSPDLAAWACTDAVRAVAWACTACQMRHLKFSGVSGRRSCLTNFFLLCSHGCAA